MDVEALWNFHVHFADATQYVFRNGRGFWLIRFGGVFDTVGRTQNRDRRGFGFTNLGKGCLKTVLVVGRGLIGLFLSNISTTNQRVDVETTRRGLIGDEVVHARLRHRRIVALVMSTATVGNQVDDHVAVETLAVFVGQLGGLDHSFWIITVDVEDRRLNGPGHIGRVGGRP